METRKITTAEELKAFIIDRNMAHVKVGVFDLDGVLRGKYMKREKFFSALDKGFGFCDVVLGWDSYDQLYETPGVTYTGWHTGYPDEQVRVLTEPVREMPDEEGMIFILGEFDGEAAELCPRGVLSRISDRAKATGFDVKAGFEYEFFVFNETPQSVRDKTYRNMIPMAPGYFGYSVIRATTE